jgi:hypothetical protein
VQDLEELLAEIQRFVGSKHGMRLVFRELSGDQLRIVRRQGP